jgi:hypothetical protein
VNFDAGYVAVSAVLSTLFGVGALVSVIVLSRRERAFLSSTYRVWLGFAALLQKRQYFHAGWGKVLIAYSMFVGLVLGGLFAAVARRK